MSELAEVPVAVLERVHSAERRVAEALGVAPDLTTDTLPLVDGYLKSVVVQAPKESRDGLLDEVGCYFGEVMRHRLDARWWVVGDDPRRWRLELRRCFLHFSPVGMAAEALTACESLSYDGSFSTLDELHEDLDAMLKLAAPISEAEYYSLSGRADILELVADWLVGRRAAAGQESTELTPDDYRRERERKAGTV
ncbi:MAG: hypothetical protein IT371_17365 [Deltaproteobacteria bacterium]|nr:hypothetical protein [Deltaproteobacteria bacterium]